MQIAPLFLSTLGALIVGVAGSLSNLVSCYREVPMPCRSASCVDIISWG